jgi:hypothetical protein
MNKAGSDVALAHRQACVNTSDGFGQAPGSDVAEAASQACVNTRRSLVASDLGKSDHGGACDSALLDLDLDPCATVVGKAHEAGFVGGNFGAAEAQGNVAGSVEPCRAAGAPPLAVGHRGALDCRRQGGHLRGPVHLCEGTVATAAPVAAAAAGAAQRSPFVAPRVGTGFKRRRIRGKSSPPASASGTPAGSSSAGTSADAQPAR